MQETSFPRSFRWLCLAVLFAGCGNEPGAPGAPSAVRPADSAAAPAISAAPVVSASASAAVSASAEVAPVASASAAVVADAGAPAEVKDAGAAKVAVKDAGAPVVAKDAGEPPVVGGTVGGPGDAGAAAEPTSPGGKIAQQIDAVFVNRKTFTARFKQEYTAKIAGVTKNSSGTVIVEKPYKVSFRYDPPNKNRIVSDGTTIKVYVADDNQMFETPVEKTQYPGALGFMMGNGIGSSFNFSLYDKAKWDLGPVLKGLPVSPNPSYDYVFFFVDNALLSKKDPGVMKRVIIVDAQGNRNRFDFEDAKQPEKIDPGEFTFTPPAGTDIKR